MQGFPLVDTFYLLYNFIMADNTSFIPKKDISLGNKNKIGRTIDIYLLISFIIFLVALISSLGVFLYKGYLNSQIEDSIIILERERRSLDIDSIKVLSKLDKRLKVSEKLLDDHVDLVGFFEILENSTLESIQFKSLDLSLEDDMLDVIMSGVADSYSSIVLQSDAFNETPNFHNPMFFDLIIMRTGDIQFSFSAQLDKSSVLYKNRLE